MNANAHRTTARRGGAAAALLGGSVFALPDAADAHGIGGVSDLPIPGWLFAWAATAVLVLSFVALGVLWPRPRLERLRRRELLTLPGWLDPAAAALGLAVTAIVVTSALAGTTDTATNLAPTFVWVVFWVALPLASVVLGDLYTPLDPWRTIARAAGSVARRAGRAPRVARPYPAALGRWPAAAGLAAIGWMELVWIRRDDPRALGLVIVSYGALQLAGMARYGIVAWRRNADPFAVYVHIVSHAAPLATQGRRVLARAPLSGLPALSVVPGTTAALCALLGTTAFDGLSRGSLWGRVGPDVAGAAAHLGLGPAAAGQVAGTVGLGLAVALVAGVYRAGVAGMRRRSSGDERAALGARFAHSLVPIAIAYVVAHYFSLVTVQGQALAALASDPLGNGANLFGTASLTVNYGLLSAATVWGVQVVALVAGHVGGLVLAHDRALTTFATHRRAVQSQRWMLVVMVGFTSLGLWLLSGA
ncbi:MAG: hypothetical protein QOJ21_97 [Solirubrobacteraceae bacterium]|jgi:hypothetical protein|nr:hypothetical protein [Solirubrobacteraceae bacterium]